MTQRSWDLGFGAVFALICVPAVSAYASTLPHLSQQLVLVAGWGAAIAAALLHTSAEQASFHRARWSWLLAGSAAAMIVAGLWVRQYALCCWGSALLTWAWSRGRVGKHDWALAGLFGLLPAFLVINVDRAFHSIVNQTQLDRVQGILDRAGTVVLIDGEKILVQAGSIEFSSLSGEFQYGLLLMLVSLVALKNRRSFLCLLLSLAMATLALASCQFLAALLCGLAGVAVPGEYSSLSSVLLIQLVVLLAALGSSLWLNKFIQWMLAPVPTIESEYGAVFDLCNAVFCWPNVMPDELLPEEVEDEELQSPDFVIRSAQVASHAWAEILRQPLMLTAGGWDCFRSWIASRQLVTGVYYAIPLVLLAVGGITMAFTSIDSLQIANNYLQRVEAEIVSVSEQTSERDQSSRMHSIARNEFSPEAAMMLERIRREHPANVQANYWVANYKAQRGQLEAARDLMRSIAPTNKKGFELAHAWLAADAVASFGFQTAEGRTQFIHDLECASQNEQTHPAIRKLFLDHLVANNRLLESLDLMVSMADLEPAYWLDVLNIAKLSGREHYVELATEKIQARIKNPLKAKAEQAADVVLLTYSAIIDRDFDRAIQLATSGIERFGDSSQVKLALSDAYLAKFEQLAEQDTDMQLLVLAMRTCEFNPRVAELAAEKILRGSVDERFMTYVNTIAKAGKATPRTYQVIAHQHLRADRYREALPFLELARRRQPYDKRILNNIAISLNRGFENQQEAADKAAEAISVALKLDATDPELWDTQGEVFNRQGRFQEAIQSLERALELDSSRRDTRTKLAQAYEAVGMLELAEAQRAIVVHAEQAKAARAQDEQTGELGQ